MSTPKTEQTVAQAGIFYRHDEGAEEQQVPDSSAPDAKTYRDNFHYAMCLVDSRRGGWVEERARDGSVIRRHPEIRGNGEAPENALAKLRRELEAKKPAELRRQLHKMLPPGSAENPGVLDRHELVERIMRLMAEAGS